MENNELKIYEKYFMKKWGMVLKGENFWIMFKVIFEFVEGFEILNYVGFCVLIFGLVWIKFDYFYYKLVVEIVCLLMLEGYGVIIGGGFGIMEVGNKGVFLIGGNFVGLNINLLFE